MCRMRDLGFECFIAVFLIQILLTKDLPGDALVSTFSCMTNFLPNCSNTDAISFAKHSQKPTVPQLQTQTTSYLLL